MTYRTELPLVESEAEDEVMRWLKGQECQAGHHMNIDYVRKKQIS